MTLVGTLVPLASLLLGACITYVVNVRQRRRDYVDDLFDKAIGAVAVASASTRFISAADPGRIDLEGAELREFDRELKRIGIENEARKLAEALEALAKLTPYLPEAAIYYRSATGPERVFSETDDIVQLIRDGHAATTGARVRRRRGRV